MTDIERLIGEFEAELAAGPGEGSRGAELMTRLGSLYRESGQHEQGLAMLGAALRAFEELVRIQERVGEKAELIVSLGRLEMIYGELGRADDAHAVLHRMLDVQREVGDALGAATTLHKLADSLRDEGHPDAASACYAQVVDEFTALGDQARAAYAMMDQAFVTGDINKAVALAGAALSIHLAREDARDVGASLDGYGLLLAEAGEYDLAVSALERSLSITDLSGDSDNIPTVLVNLGRVCADAGLGAKAIDYYERALSLISDADARANILAALEQLRAQQV